MKKYKINISEERHEKDLESLGSIFMPIVKGLVSSEDLVGVEIMYKWKDIVGSEIASFSQPLKTKYNPKTDIRTLCMEVPLGGYALEVQHKEQYLIDKINAYFGYRAIHNLNIMQNANMQPILIEKQDDKNLEKIVSDEDMTYLNTLTEDIKDEKLREILIKIGKNVISDQ